MEVEMFNTIELDINRYKNIIVIDEPLNNKNYRINERADLILEIGDGKFYLQKNRYGPNKGQVILKDYEMAKLLLAKM